MTVHITGISQEKLLANIQSALSHVSGSNVNMAKTRQAAATIFGLRNEHLLPALFTDASACERVFNTEPADVVLGHVGQYSILSQCYVCVNSENELLITPVPKSVADQQSRPLYVEAFRIDEPSMPAEFALMTASQWENFIIPEGFHLMKVEHYAPVNEFFLNTLGRTAKMMELHFEKKVGLSYYPYLGLNPSYHRESALMGDSSASYWDWVLSQFESFLFSVLDSVKKERETQK